MQILLFSWAQTYAPNNLLIQLAASACQDAKVPVALHLDHAQSPEAIRAAADIANAFDSIMVDMSHYEKDENLALTKELTAYCHERGIATEAEPGRMNGGEDGVADTGDLEGVLTTPEEAMRFVGTGIDILAPAFGNVHGNYGGVKNMKLQFNRLVLFYCFQRFSYFKITENIHSLESIRAATSGRVTLVLHGTNGFPDSLMQSCVKGGMTRCNVNELVLSKYSAYVAENTGKVPLTVLMEEGAKLIQELVEHQMDVVGSTGKA